MKLRLLLFIGLSVKSCSYAAQMVQKQGTKRTVEETGISEASPTQRSRIEQSISSSESSGNNERTRELNKLLFKAIATNDLDMLEKLFSSGEKPAINQPFDFDSDILLPSKSKEIFWSAQVLDHRTFHGVTPLLFALLFTPPDNQETIVRFLLDHGADVNKKGTNAQRASRTPLNAALSVSPLAVVKLLIKHGAQIRQQSSYPFGDNMTAAIKSGDTDKVQLLMNAGLSLTDPTIQNPYLVAVEANDEHMRKFLNKQNLPASLTNSRFVGAALQERLEKQRASYKKNAESKEVEHP